MNTAIAQPQQTSPAVQFRKQTTTIASAMLIEWVGEERAKLASGRLAVALSAAAACAKNPTDFYECTPQSVAAVIAISALTGIYVSTGATALAYAVPRRPRRGEKPQLQYQLSHRGINALAGRADRIMIAVPIGVNDKISVDESGDVICESRDVDNPPKTEEELRGIMLVVKVAKTGVILLRQWVAKSVINDRRAISDSFQFAEKPGNEWAQKTDPWHRWYVEMASKTAMHFAISRGWCVVDDTEAARALNADVEADIPLIAQVQAGTRSDQVSALLAAPDVPAIEAVPQAEPEGEREPGDEDSAA